MGITTHLDGYPAEGLGGLAWAFPRSRWPSLRHARRRRHALRAAGHHEGRVPRRQGRRRSASPSASACSPTARPTRSRRSSRRTCRRHRHAREHRLPRGRQDRHHRQLQRRLVRRLHAEPRVGRLGRLPERAASRCATCTAIAVAGRHLPGADLARLHEHRARAATATLPAATHARALVALLRQHSATTGSRPAASYDGSPVGTHRRRRPAARAAPRHQGLRPAPLRGAAAGARRRPRPRSPRSRAAVAAEAATGLAAAPPRTGNRLARSGRAAPLPHARGVLALGAALRRLRGPRRAAGSAGLATRAGHRRRLARLAARVRCASPGCRRANGRLAGPLFYAGLWLALALYVVVLVARARPAGPPVLWVDRRAARPLPARPAAPVAGRVLVHRLRAPGR